MNISKDHDLNKSSVVKEMPMISGSTPCYETKQRFPGTEAPGLVLTQNTDNSQ